MEVAGKKDGRLTKQVGPPGYSNYVGNKQYGSWRTDSNGNSFWAFYGQYAFISSMMGMGMSPIYRTHYNDYGRYSSAGRSYYGPRSASGVSRYGTFSETSKRNNPAFHSRYQSKSAFKNKVDSKVSRSRSGSRYGGNTRSNRTTTRSRRSSRSYSRSGGK